MEQEIPKTGSIADRIKQLVDELAGGKNTVFAEKLGVSEANIRSYIRGVQPKADVLQKIVITYDVNAMWLLTGLGWMTVPNQLEQVPPPMTSETTIKDFFATYEPFIQQKDAKIIQQAEEIGRLKERNAQLEREKEQLEMEISRTVPPKEAARVFTNLSAPEPQKV